MTFASIAVITLLSPVDAKAEVPSCIDLSNPTIGATCYTEVEYNARVENSPSAQSFSIPQAARTGFVIVDTRNFQESRIGTTNGPNVIITRPGTAINIRQAWEQQYQDFTDFYQHTEAEVRARGINFGGMSDIRQRTEEQFNNAINQLTQIQSSSEAIVINGSAQAQWRTWAGVREYTSGGTLRGRIRVYQRYVGTVDRPNQISSNARNQILALVQSADPSSQSTTVGIGFYRQGNQDEVYLVFRPNGRYCHVQNPDQMNAFGGSGQVRSISNLSFTRACFKTRWKA